MKEICEKYLNSQFGGDADVVNEIYGEYASSSRTKADEASAALSAGDWQSLDRIAHTVKGNALAVGDVEMSETAISLRQAAVLKDAAEAAPLVERIKALAAGL